MDEILAVRFFHPLGSGFVLGFLSDQVVRGNRRQNSLVRCQIRRLLENVHRHGRSIQLVHRRNPQQHFHRANHAHRIVKFVDQRTRAIVSADGQPHRPVRIDVVRAGLGVIFHDEDRRIFPIGARRDRFHEPPHRVVVVRDHELRCRKSGLQSGGMIVGESQYVERRHGVQMACLALRDKDAKLREPFSESRISSAIRMRVVPCNCRIKRARRIQCGFVAVHGHAVRRRHVKASEARAVMIR